MSIGTAFHIFAGGTGIVTGFVALYATKGARLHRKAGMVFVVAMLGMAFSGGLLAVMLGRTPKVNLPAALLTAYLVTTALATVRPPARGGHWLSRGGLAVALGVGLVSLAFGFEALASGGELQGIPAFPYFLFGVVGLLAGAFDVRVMRAGGVRGRARLARHLWRMCFALYIAAMSFFVGQADTIPEPLRIPALLAAPIVAVLLTMFYWLWRVRRPLRRVGKAR